MSKKNSQSDGWKFEYSEALRDLYSIFRKHLKNLTSEISFPKFTSFVEQNSSSSNSEETIKLPKPMVYTNAQLGIYSRMKTVSRPPNKELIALEIRLEKQSKKSEIHTDQLGKYEKTRNFRNEDLDNLKISIDNAIEEYRDIEDSLLKLDLIYKEFFGNVLEVDN